MRTSHTPHPDDEAIVDRFVQHAVVVIGCGVDSVYRHRSNLRRFLRWCRLQELDAALLSDDDLRRFLEHERQRGLSPASLATALGSLRPFYDHISPDGPNPARSIRLPPVPARHMPPYLPNEATAILDGLRCADDLGGRFDLAVVMTFAATGVRRTELVRLLTGDLDLDAALLRVTGGPDGGRVVPLSTEAVAMLSGYLAELRPLCPPSDRLFANPRISFESAGYGRLEAQAAGNLVRRAGRRSNVTGPHSCHRWRVTAAVDLLRAGVTVEEVQQRMGIADRDIAAAYLRFLDNWSSATTCASTA